MLSQDSWFWNIRTSQSNLRAPLLQRFLGRQRELCLSSLKSCKTNGRQNIFQISKLQTPKDEALQLIPFFVLFAEPGVSRMTHVWHNPCGFRVFVNKHMDSHVKVSSSPRLARWLMGFSHWHPNKGARSIFVPAHSPNRAVPTGTLPESQSIFLLLPASLLPVESSSPPQWHGKAYLSWTSQLRDSTANVNRSKHKEWSFLPLYRLLLSPPFIS